MSFFFFFFAHSTSPLLHYFQYISSKNSLKADRAIKSRRYRGGEGKALSFCYPWFLFLSFSLLISVEEFQVGVSRHLLFPAPFLLLLLLVFTLQPLPFPLLQFTLLAAFLRDTEGISFMQFIPPFFPSLPLSQVLLHLPRIAFFSLATTLFISAAANLTVPNVMPGLGVYAPTNC